MGGVVLAAELVAVCVHANGAASRPQLRGHRIPDTDTTLLLGPGLVDTALGILDELVNEYATSI